MRRRLSWVSPLGPITVATLSITAVWAGGLKDRYGIRAVGAIEPGLPRLTVRALMRDFMLHAMLWPASYA